MQAKGKAGLAILPRPQTPSPESLDCKAQVQTAPSIPPPITMTRDLSVPLTESCSKHDT